MLTFAVYYGKLQIWDVPDNLREEHRMEITFTNRNNEQWRKVKQRLTAAIEDLTPQELTVAADFFETLSKQCTSPPPEAPQEKDHQ